jgi:hypothetical protein
MTWALARTLCFSAISITGAAPAFAQGSAPAVKVQGSVRLRYEAIEGQARAGFDSDDRLINVRTQIAAEYRAGDIRIGAEMFDSRAYGADPGTPLTTNEVNALELVQAYVAGDIEIGRAHV